MSKNPTIKQHALPGFDVEEIAYSDKTSKSKDFTDMERVGRILLLGGGVQSTTMAYMALEGELQLPDLVVFADTGNEPPWVYATFNKIQMLLATKGVTVISTSRDNYNDLFGDIMSGKATTSLPVYVKNADGSVGHMSRNCTSDYKTGPANKAIREWALTRAHAITTKQAEWSPNPIVQHVNETLDALEADRPEFYDQLKAMRALYARPIIEGETTQVRMKRSVYVETWFGMTTDEMERTGERGPSWQRTRYPLVELGMSRTDCINWLTEHGYSVPHKSACVGCPYRSDPSWKWFKDNHSDLFQQVIDFDEWLRSDAIKTHPTLKSVRGTLYMHRSCVPIGEIDFQDILDTPILKRMRKMRYLKALKLLNATGVNTAIKLVENGEIDKAIEHLTKWNGEAIASQFAEVDHNLKAEFLFDSCSSDGAGFCHS